jgi:hypothetical protein
MTRVQVPLAANPMHRIDAYRMIQRRAANLGMRIRIGCHTFRSTGITACLDACGTLENAQAMAAHESPRTTTLYDRAGDEITRRGEEDRDLTRLSSTQVGLVPTVCSNPESTLDPRPRRHLQNRGSNGHLTLLPNVVGVDRRVHIRVRDCLSACPVKKVCYLLR